MSTPLRTPVQSPRPQVGRGRPVLDPRLAAMRARAATAAPPAKPAASRTSPASVWNAAVARTANRRACMEIPQQFELPESDVHTDTISPEAISAGTFAELDSERAVTRKRAHMARRAIAVCNACPMLQLCRDEVLEDLNDGARPIDTVVAGVAWTADGVPDPHIHKAPKAAPAEAYTLDALLDAPVVSTTPPELEWLPDNLQPEPDYDEVVVDGAMSPRRVEQLQNGTATGRDRFVTQSAVDLHRLDIDGQIVISYADEREIVRRAVADEYTPNLLATILGCCWQRAADALHAAGADYFPGRVSVSAQRLRALRDQRAANGMD